MANEWYYARDGQTFGPVTGKRLKELGTAGLLRRDDLIWSPGYSVWRAAKKFRGLLPRMDASTASPAMPLFWKPSDSAGEFDNRFQGLYLGPDSRAPAGTPPLPETVVRKPRGGNSTLVAAAPPPARTPAMRHSLSAAIAEVGRTPAASPVTRFPVVLEEENSAAEAATAPLKGSWARISPQERMAIGGGLLAVILIYGVLLVRALG